jgi:hypothetical protein
MWNMCIQLDSITIPHLCELTSLDLGPILHSELGWDWSTDPPDETVRQTKDMLSIPSEIWRVLSHERILLREITVAKVNGALLDYLASYSGVEKLMLSKTGKNTSVSNTLADKFCTSVLPKHTDSIRILQLPSTFEGTKWCYDAHVYSALLQCKQLTYLRVPLHS